MTKRTFTKKWLRGLLWEDHDEGEIVSDKIVDTSRWSIHHELIFKFDEKFYRTSYSVGATEQQDERPFQYQGDEIKCTEVRPVEKTVIDYVEVKE